MGKAPPRPAAPITMAQYLDHLFSVGLRLIPLEHHGKHTTEPNWNKRGESTIADLMKRGAPMWRTRLTDLMDAVGQPVKAWMPSGFNIGVLNEPSATIVLDMDDPLASAALDAGLKHLGGGIDDLVRRTDFKWLSPRGTKFMYRRPRGLPGSTQRIVRRNRTPDGRVQVQTVIEFRGTGQDVLPFSHRADRDFTLTWAHSGGLLPEGAVLGDCPMILAELLRRLASHDTALITVMQQAAGTDPTLTGMDAVGDFDYPTRLAGCAAERMAVNANFGVEQLLQKHGYSPTTNGRWKAPGSHHAAGIAPSKTERGVWVCYHESDALSGRMDAWRAFVELEHGGDLEAARQASRDFSTLRVVERKNTAGEPAVKTKETKPTKPQLATVAAAPQPRVTAALTLADIETDPIAEQVLIKGVCLAGSLIYLGGSWSAGKTAMALAIGCGIASGLGDVLGQPCMTGTVVYFAVEDAPTVYRRARAWRRHFKPDWDGRSILFYPALDLTDEDATSSALDTIKADCDALGIDPPVLMIVDTQAAATAGVEENSMQETTVIIDRINRMRTAMACAVALVHHHGKDEAKGLRGSSALSAAADSILAFDLDDSITPAVQTATVTKSRGMQRRRDPLKSQVRVIELGGKNNFDEPITAMILVPAEERTLAQQRSADWKDKAEKGMRPEHRQVCAMVDTLILTMPTGVPVELLITKWLETHPGKRANRAATIETAVTKGIDSGRLAWVSVAERTLRSGYVVQDGDKEKRF